MNQRIEDRIGAFFVKKKNELITHRAETEVNLLKSLNFSNELSLLTDRPSGNALFGWGSLKSDFKPKTDEDTIIEVKYLRIRKAKNGPNQYCECDVKNALSQIVEQALCKKVSKAILVIIDTGRANNREWNEHERMFISMFKQNPFNICLSIVRIKLEIEQTLDRSTVTYEVI